MKKCATCGFEYDAAYDGCPVCARTATAGAVAPAVGYGPGNAMAAVGALLGYFVLAGLLTALAGDAMTAIVITLVCFAAIVTADAFTLHKPAPEGFKAEGMVGSHPLMWGLAVLGIAIVGIPLYFYNRPRIAIAYAAR